jgi:hypothetical protein
MKENTLSNRKSFYHVFFDMPHDERVKNGRKGAYVAGFSPYSKAEDSYLIENYQKLPLTHIAKVIGRSARSVLARSKKLIRDGFITNNNAWRKSHYTKQEDDVIIANKDTMSFAEVAQILGRSRDSVKVRAGKLKVSYQKLGDTSPALKHTNEDIELMRQLSDAGLNYCEIARKFDADRSYVRKICLFEARFYSDVGDYLSSRKRQVESIDGRN